MFGKRILLLVLLTLSLMISFSGIFAGNNNGGDIPIVCIPMATDTIEADVVKVNPYEQDVPFNVYFITNGGNNIREYEFSLDIPGGVQYADNYETGDWNEDSVNVYHSNGIIEVQGWGDTLVASGSPDTLTLITLYFDIDDSVRYDQMKLVELVNDVYFRTTGVADTCAYDPAENDGYFIVPDSTIWVNIGEVTAYSNQAMEVDTPPQNTMYATVPIYAYSELDIKSIIFWFDVDTSKYVYAGYNAIDPSVYIELGNMGVDSTLISVQGISAFTPLTIDTSGSAIVEVYFRIKDFGARYNSVIDFDTTLILDPHDSAYAAFYLWGTDSNRWVNLIEDENYFGGALYLPQYECSYPIGSGTVDVTDHVAIPVISNCSFPTQSFQHIIAFKDEDFNSLDSVVAGGAPVPQNIEFTIIDVSEGNVYCEIYSSSPTDSEYTWAEFDTLYTLYFTADSSLDHNTYIRPATEWGFYGYAHDYFTPYSSGNKIFRSNLTGGFSMSIGTVHPYGYVAFAEIPYENEVINSQTDINGDDAIPYLFNLGQNYPNPFNAHTNIQFSIADEGYVVLDIYDMLGRKVRTLCSEYMTPGEYNIMWDGTTDRGEQISSGFYFYHISTANYSQSRKMLLLK